MNYLLIVRDKFGTCPETGLELSRGKSWGHGHFPVGGMFCPELAGQRSAGRSALK
jgi:hypothetical protein